MITAAHCISPGIPGLTFSRVVLGLVDLSKFEKPDLYLENEAPQAFHVTEKDVTVHDKYAPEDISGKVMQNNEYHTVYKKIICCCISSIKNIINSFNFSWT